jgi:hypothetical protein
VNQRDNLDTPNIVRHEVLPGWRRFGTPPRPIRGALPGFSARTAKLTEVSVLRARPE